jgi:hypothetical protein
MGYKIADHPLDKFSRETNELFDDFSWFVTAHQWTSAVAGTGTVTKAGDSGTDIRLFSTADNDAAVLATTNEDFKYTANKDIYAEFGGVNLGPPNTNALSAFFGFADALAATTVADTTGAVTATDALGITLVTGSLLWRFHTEINGTATSTTSNLSYTASTRTHLKIEAIPVSSTVFECRPYVDGVQLEDSNGVPIMHRVTLGTATDMDFGAVIKGHHADDSVNLVDWVYASQVR